MTADDWWKAIHDRIIRDDPIAPAELAEQALPLLQSHLQQCRLEVKDPDLIDNAAIDALMSYIKNPLSFKQDKRSLLGFLRMAAEGDLRNALSKESRRQKRERRDQSVELCVIAGKKESARGDLDADGMREVESKLNKLFPDPRDRQLAELVIEKERSTNLFSKVLGIQHLAKEEQRKDVKRHKDRIKKILKRKGG